MVKMLSTACCLPQNVCVLSPPCRSIWQKQVFDKQWARLSQFGSCTAARAAARTQADARTLMRACAKLGWGRKIALRRHMQAASTP